MNFIDAESSNLKDTKTTPEGFLVAEAFAVRSGIQLYTGSEVKDSKPIVRVYRPPEEVFKKSAVESFIHAPITIDHPPGGVSSESWRKDAVGEVSTDVLRDGERLKLSLVLKDAAAVAQVMDGKRRQLSAGYSCVLDRTPGVTPEGEKYDMVQRDIRINHLALVERGRAGNCQIGDSAWGALPMMDQAAVEFINHALKNWKPQTEEEPMTTKPVVLGDKAVQVVAEDAEHVTNHLAALNQQLADARSEAQTKDGEIAALKQQLADAHMTPEKLAKLVADRAILTAGYKAIIGKDADAMASDSDLRYEVVALKLGAETAKAMSDEAITGAFRALTTSGAMSKADPLREAGGIVHNDVQTVDVESILTMSGVPFKKQGA